MLKQQSRSTDLVGDAGLATSGRSAADKSCHDASEGEKALGKARLILAAGLIVDASLLPPSHAIPSAVAHATPFLYGAYSLLALFVLSRIGSLGSRVEMLIHLFDLAWVVPFSFSRHESSAPFLVFVLFTLLAAAYRWGLVATLETALVLLLLPLLLVPGRFAAIDRSAVTRRDFVADAICVFVVAILLGYLADQVKQLRTRTRVMERIMAIIAPESNMSEILGEVLRVVADIFAASRALLFVEDVTEARLFRWEVLGTRGSAPPFAELEPSEGAPYLFSGPAESWYLRWSWWKGPVIAVALDREGKKLEPAKVSIPTRFLIARALRSSMVVSFELGSDVRGRLFLFDPRPGADPESELQFLQSLVSDVAPALQGVYLLRRLQSRTRVAERARIARDLHDGVLQSLIAAETHIAAFRRRAPAANLAAAGEYERIQQLLRREVLNTRDLIQQLKVPEIEPGKLQEYVSDLAAKFESQTGIATRVISQWDGLLLSPRVCGELGAIVREALSNVRKHSGARNVSVEFRIDQGPRKLVICDDGCGFPFSGRRSLAQLEADGLGPGVIEERVRVLGGDLIIESGIGRGTRLEVVLPR